jgi:hypothetical protein
MIKMFGPPWVRRTILALISFLIVIVGASTLFPGKLEYYNWWGGLIFASLANHSRFSRPSDCGV